MPSVTGVFDMYISVIRISSNMFWAHRSTTRTLHIVTIVIFSIIVIIIKTNMAIITTTCSGQREALPKPSMLSLRIPRTEENGLWPIWKCKDADSFDKGNGGDDLDESVDDCEEDGFAGGFSILTELHII